MQLRISTGILIPEQVRALLGSWPRKLGLRKEADYSTQSVSGEREASWAGEAGRDAPSAAGSRAGQTAIRIICRYEGCRFLHIVATSWPICAISSQFGGPAESLLGGSAGSLYATVMSHVILLFCLLLFVCFSRALRALLCHFAPLGCPSEKLSASSSPPACGVVQKFCTYGCYWWSFMDADGPRGPPHPASWVWIVYCFCLVWFWPRGLTHPASLVRLVFCFGVVLFWHPPPQP